MKYLRKFIELPWSDRYLLIKVALLLGIIRIALLLLRFSIVRRLLTRLSRQFHTVSVDKVSYQKRIIWAVKVAGRRLLGDKPCLPQALTVQYLLDRMGKSTVLRIGVAKDMEDQLIAHAWVECDGEIIIGGRFSRFVYTPLQPVEKHV